MFYFYIMHVYVFLFLLRSASTLASICSMPFWISACNLQLCGVLCVL